MCENENEASDNTENPCFPKSSYLKKFDKNKLIEELKRCQNGYAIELDSDDDDDQETLSKAHLFITDTKSDSNISMALDTEIKKPEKEHRKSKLSMSLESGLEETFKDLDLSVLTIDFKKKKKKGAPISIKKTILDERDVMEKSVIKPGFEKLDNVPPYLERLKTIKKKRKEEREKTKGSSWYNMPATELTDEVKNDLLVIKMRNALDPKKFYKSNDLKVLPKYFQIGHVVDNQADFYHSRVPKKQRKKTLVDELLADAEFQKFKKKKTADVYSARNKTKKAYQDLHTREKKKKKMKHLSKVET
ncbi:Deoxynucleotidyltransferase terminal-interacting protein 2 [Nymphon striatum]|nr:Deoxynucleotidyltransferase terminal-interacting protein 2 [Nymphon striatum]